MKAPLEYSSLVTWNIHIRDRNFFSPYVARNQREVLQRPFEAISRI